jgi:hypothetical protein
MWMFVDELDSIGTGRVRLGYMPDKTISLFCFCDSRLLSQGGQVRAIMFFVEVYFHAEDIESCICILHARDYQILPSYVCFEHYQCL